MGTYTIGEVAERSGFSASALRYYERIGLVAPSARTGAGYRMYDDDSLARLSFIARAKQLGCSLEEVTDLVAVWDGQQCGPVQQRFHRLVSDKIGDARRQIDELVALTTQLEDAAARLAGPAVDGPCRPGCACLADAPLACTLPAADLPDRIEDWKGMLAHATARTRTADGGVRIALDGTVDLAALARLVADEHRCCSFFSFAITVGPDGTALEVRAPGGAEAMVEELFGRM